MGKRGRARRRRGGGSPPPLPKGLLQTFATADALLPELQSGADLREAVRKRRAELRAFTEPYDAVHLLAHVSLSEATLDADTYRESDNTGLAYVVELLAAELLSRPGRAGSQDHSPPLDAHVTEEVRRLTHEAALLESFRRWRAAGGSADPESAARGRAAMQHLMLRNPGWPWQEHRVLRGLFGDPRFAAPLQEALGFTAEDAIQCTDALPIMLPRQLHEHLHAAGAPAARFDERHPAFGWASSQLGGWQDRPADEQARFMPLVWALNHPGDALLVTADALAESAGVEPSAAAGLLRALAQTWGQPAGEDWFTAAERVRYRPYVEVESGAYLVSVPGNDLWSLRSLMEERVKARKGYVAHRGRWLERQATALLERALAPDQTRQSIDFRRRDSTGTEVNGEIDALLRCGDAAITVEAKSATLRPGARRGGEALISHLRETLTKAARQATASREALHDPAATFTDDGGPVDFGESVREVHPVVVTLDDLSAVAPVLWELESSRVLPQGVTLPWVVTLHELEQVCDTVEWPVQLVHFLRRRSRLNRLGGLVATDELDWWMHYLQVGLYFEGEPRGGRRRLTSMTDDLDAWNLWVHGHRETEAPKPSMNVDARTRRFLDTISAERPPGWVPAACALLEVSGSARVNLWKECERLRRRAEKRGMIQRATLGFEDAPQPMLICAAIVPSAESRSLSKALEVLVAQRLDELGDQPVLGIGMVAASKRPYDALVVVEHERWSPPG
jgi:hypothetical protein